MTSAWHLYVVHVPDGTRRRLFDDMRAAGVGVNVHYIPVHLQPYYRKRGFKLGDFPEAERHYAAALSLPLFPGLCEADQDRIVAAMGKALEMAA
jgi:dTDP-4-amino-4,6-dideoxygalactose transaminase